MALAGPAAGAPTPPEEAAADRAAIRFEEVAEAAGARFVHHLRSFPGEHGEVLGMFTAGGAAVAVGDYDGDGDDDLFVTDSGLGRPNRLLRNELVETGALAFTDVTERAGVGGGNDERSIVSDALFFDADADGRQDLLVARFGTPILYRNTGGGRFEDVTAASGLTKFANTIAAIAFDADADGRLDLLLGHYFRPVDLLASAERRVLPDDLDQATNGGGVTLWRNETVSGDQGTGAGPPAIRFVERTEEAGFAHHTGWTLDLGHADLDGDGDQDVYLACDYGTDRLFVNRGDGTFDDVTEEAIGIDTRKGMNVEFGDFDRDGRLDVYVTNITDEYMRECNMLWHNHGDGTFSDVSKETGTCDTLWGWAAKFGDFDHDGWQDLFVVNGLRSAGPENYIPVLVEMILRPGIDFADPASWPPIGSMSWSGYQRTKLFRNLEGQAFKEVAAAAGVGDDQDGRGLGMADFDHDGRLDLYVSNAGQPSLLYRNVTEPAGRWVQARLVGTRSNRDAIGARMTIRAGDATLIREVDGGNGYASQSSRRLHFGLGAAETIDSATVRWPSGLVESYDLEVDRIVTLREGEGVPVQEREGAGQGIDPEELLWHHRNLGKAFYENPATQYRAVEELARALALAPDSTRERLNYGLALLRAGRTEEGVAELRRVQAQDPSLPHTWFNLGIASKREGRTRDAIAQLERMVELVPGEPISHFNLGLLYKLEDEPEKALAHFEAAARSGPELAGPRYQLYNSYRALGRKSDAERALAEFRRLKEGQEGAAVPEDLEWSRWAELYDPVEPPAEPPPPAEPVWTAREVATGLDAGTAGLAVLDADGDGGTDLLAFSAAGAALFADGVMPVEEAGLGGLRDVRAAVPGDLDDDGLADLVVIAADGAALYGNAGGRFERFPAALPAGDYGSAIWLDYDHDYDLDLFLLGARPALVRNPGGGSAEGWVDRTADFPFDEGEALAAVSLHVVADSQGRDLAVAYADRPGVLYRDRLGGRFEPEPLAGLPAGAAELHAEDLDGDGWVDLAAGDALLVNREGAGWERRPAPAPPFVLLDPDNAGRRVPVGAPGETPAAALAAADFDGDRRADLAAVGRDGVLRLYANATPGDHRALTVRLTGVKNRKLAAGAEVEVKAGSLYQKQTYRGVPLVFGLGERDAIDTVRITWPNGLVQNEARQEPGELAIEEAPRLSGSCPMVFAWNGERFEFVSDVLGVAPLGASAGDGGYFPVDHDEVIQVPRGGLVERDGRYELRITEELREVAFLDRVRLIAVDHPEEIEIFVNDQFRAPPFPPHRLHATARRIPPVAARDHRGRDVLDRVLARDRTYPDGFARDSAGAAERHRLDLDFGAAAATATGAGVRTLLVLNGWVDWADGSTFLAAAQRPGGGLEMPRLSVRDEAGRWVTAVAEMGIPAGKPKTIVVDLTGAWRSASRAVRIESNLCLYWDEVFLAVAAAEPPLMRTVLAPAAATLRFRGFSRPLIHPERKQPESFDYHAWMPVSMWNPTPGLYTRYGPVRPLLGAVDDRFVIMGSGDELRLAFDAVALPPLPSGWVRDFLLEVDGWAKDGDANTAFSQTVEPLPFHGMSRYPYPDGETFPDGPEHRRWRAIYNTRPALELLRPLRPGEAR